MLQAEPGDGSLTPVSGDEAGCSPGCHWDSCLEQLCVTSAYGPNSIEKGSWEAGERAERKRE